MTRFQALFIYWLREKCNCSWRAIDAHFNNRYNKDGTRKNITEEISFNIWTIGGNQLGGMILCQEASKLLNIQFD